MLRALLKTLPLGVIAAVVPLCSATPPGESAEEHFVRRIAPLLHDKCLPCHGGDPDKLEAALDLRTRDGLLRGGESGSPALVPDRPDDSPLYRVVM